MCTKKIISILILSLMISLTLSALKSPEILWRYTTGGRIITPPVEGSDGTIYFCSEDRYLYALNNDGSILWRTSLEDRITETLSIGPDGTLYTGSKRGFFLAFNPIGEKLWKIDLKGSPVGNPAISPDGSLFIVTSKGWFYSVSHTGFIRWEVKLPAIPAFGPVLGNDIYIALNNERIYSYNINGNRLWTFLLSGNAESLVLSMDKIYAGTDNSTLVSIDFTGARVWNVTLDGFVNSIIVLTNNRVLCSSGNNIIMLDSSGNTLWNRTERKIQLDLAAYSNLIVSLDSEGSITWLDFDGLVVSQLNGGAPVRRILGASDGNIYLGSKDWLLYKYGFTNFINDNYVEYLWPAFGAGSGNRNYLNIKKTDFVENKMSESTDFVYLTELSKILDEKNLNKLLDEIEFRLLNRNYDAGKSYLIDILELLASECITRPLYEDGHLINDFPVIRSRAVDILGITGSLQTIEFLVDILNYEWDDYVINSTIRSLGNLQSDKNEFITNGISNYYSTNETNLSQRYVNQVLLTVKKLKSYNGTTNIKLLELITQIFLNSSSRATKELALDTINSLKK